MRNFPTGATRNTDDSKLDFEGFLSPLVLERFAEYMHSHRKQADGVYRAADNWQKGMPLDAYMKSGWRHFFSWWKAHRGGKTEEDIEESMMALMFNVMGYAHEYLKQKYELLNNKSKITGQPAYSTQLDGKCDKCGGRISNQYNGPSVDFSYVWDSHSVLGQLRNSRHLYDHINNQVICLEKDI